MRGILRHGALWRWSVVLVGVAVLVSLPAVVAALPVHARPVPAAALLRDIARSSQVGYSGDAESVGGLALPVTTAFSDLTDLFGGRTRLRVWWRGTDEWRADSLTASGETDVHRDQSGTWTWNYERNTATRADEPSVRLPRAADVDPAQLGRRLLSEARPAEVRSLPARRVAGRPAAGLRLVPADPRSTIGRVDVWADPTTGLPVDVAVYGRGGGRPLLATSYLSLSTVRPAARTVAFSPPPGARTRFEQVTDLADAANRFAPFHPAQALAGYPLRQRVASQGAVGTYGRGVTVLSAIPLPGRVSGPLRRQLAGVPGLTSVAQGSVLTVGPLGMLLTTAGDRGRSWLVVGTVTTATLQQAAGELPTELVPR